MIAACLTIAAVAFLQSGDPPAPPSAVAVTQADLPPDAFRRSTDGFARVKPSRVTLLACDAPPRAVTVNGALDMPEARSQPDAKAIWVEARPVGGKWHRVGGVRWDTAEVVWQWDGFFERATPEGVAALDRWLSLVVIDVEASNGSHFELARATVPITLGVSRSREGTVSLVPLPTNAYLNVFRGGAWNEVENDGLQMTLSSGDSPDLTISLDPTAQSLKVVLVGGADQQVREMVRELDQVKRLLKTAPEDMAETYRMQQKQLEEGIKTARAAAAADAKVALPEGPVLRVSDGPTGRVRFEITIQFTKPGDS